MTFVLDDAQDVFTYAGGRDQGICATADGPIGLANGFEWIRARTAASRASRSASDGADSDLPVSSLRPIWPGSHG